MKNRQEELKVIETINYTFSQKIIPLVEIIKEEYTPRYLIDENSGDFVYKKGAKRKTKIKVDPRDEDIVTLNKLNQRLLGKKAFVDYFRFHEKEYENKDFSGVELSFKVSRNYNLYKSKILELGLYNNLIPVISIKEGFEMSRSDLTDLWNDLKATNNSVAIRFTDTFLDVYSTFFERVLTENDYLMIDIREQDVESKFIELEEFKDLKTKASKILLNSPRIAKIRNKQYENLAFTNKIDNSAAIKYSEYNLDGFGDFGGLKDVLPENSSGNGTGAALGLIFLRSSNAFYSVVNEDTTLGLKGYEYVRKEILSKKEFLDSDNKCKIIKKIENMKGKYGNWGTWNNMTLSRYILQQYQG